MPDPRATAPFAGRALIDPDTVSRAVYEGIRHCAVTLRADFLRACEAAAAAAQADPRRAREASVLASIVDNARIGACEGAPICQDTGSVWVCLEAGEQTLVPGDAFAGVNAAVARAYEEGALRMSILRDALLDRVNTGDNAPAFCDVDLVAGKGARLHVLLKGGGSDNASRVVMLPPSAGEEGVIAEVVRCVREKAANACPPLVIGVGVGATFDKVASLAKHALLRPVGTRAASREAARFEERLLQAVNATGIGAGALGGDACALAVHLRTAPCHIAALPLAINMGCCAMRSCTFELIDEEGHALESPRLLSDRMAEEVDDGR